MFSKKIVAAAALLALAAGAQAQVKVYGQVDMSVGSFKAFTGPATLKSVTRVESGAMSTGSFIGFSGSEDLGGGLKAGFVLESYLAADTGAANTPFWSRSSHLSLSGGFGKVALGQYDSVLYTMLTGFSPFGDSQIFAPSQVLHYGPGSAIDPFGVTTNALGQGTSWVNSVTYETPNMAGLSATVQYAPKENSVTNNPNNKNNFGVGVNYSAGPLSAAAIYSSTGANPGGSYTSRVLTTGLAASYDFGVATLSGEYTTSKDKNNNGGTEAKTKFYQLGATVPVSAAGKVMVAYGQRKVENGFYASTYNPAGKAKQFSVGYEHNLSKRTSVYVAATNLKLNASLYGSNTSSKNYAFGIKHNF